LKDTYYPVIVRPGGIGPPVVTGVINSMTLINPPKCIPATGNFSVNVFWTSNITGETNLHLDLSDVTQSYLYDGGASTVVLSPGNGTVKMLIQISTTMPLADSYTLHAYMASTQLSATWGGSGNDWQYAVFNGFTSETISCTTTSTSSTSSSSLSNGAIAGIVIGVVVGTCLLCLIFFFTCRSLRGSKDGKFSKNVDEPSQQRGEVSDTTDQNVEMGDIAHD